MLSIEKKRTDKIDIVKPLTKYIKEQFSKSEADAHETAIQTLNSMREDIRNLQDKTETSKDMLWKYYSILSSLEIRFPIGESNVRISFPWTDSYRQRKTSLYSIYFERSCILFNYGSIISQIGASQSRSNVEGIKKACNSFQCAAGVFNSLREYISMHPECFASPDFSSESLGMIVALMIAQAQECIYEKAAMDNLSESIQSKLAAQVAENYETVDQLLNSATLKTLVDRNWSSTILIKVFLFKSIASYKHAKGLETISAFGEQVARLNSATDSINSAKANIQRFTPTELRDTVEKYLVTIIKYRDFAKKDNDTIYHDMVPPEHKLTPIEKKSIAKSIPLPEISFVDPFNNLVPYSVKEDAAYYNDQKEALLKKEVGNIDFNNQSAKASLLSMGLPGSIEALEVGIPKALQEKMDIVSSEHGVSNITSLLENLQLMSEEDSAICLAAGSILKKEEDEDNEMRNKYQASWHRTPSYTLTANLNQDLAKYQMHLQHSTKSDGFIRKKFEDNKQLIGELEHQDQVISLLPSNMLPSSKIPEIASLTVLLNDLDSLMATREQIAEKLKDLSKKDDITLKLIAPTRDKSVIYAEEIKKYEPLQISLNESFLKQQQIIENIRRENEKFTNSKSSQGGEREEILQRYANAFKIYQELKSNLDEGIQFYANFQEILVKFRTRCEDFANEREKERIELVRQISAGVNPYSPAPYTPSPNSSSGGYSPYGEAHQSPVMQQHHQPPPLGPPQSFRPPPYIHGAPQQPMMPPPHQYQYHHQVQMNQPPPPYQQSFAAPPPSFSVPPQIGKMPPQYKPK
ncbi:hypothetical protein CYY_008367 [Polysphondylium violaceum]|uniref:BRO1 domain-containing protein n=1 Tax=Polysphondylium violaceum TaxID=133409 RepID=A0A8J4PN64_9MYCE|nr:hypothetical protein CYY_008367 [Polysphondylium violaceum]